MVFDYYKKLTRTQQRIYRESDRIASVRLNSAAALLPVVRALADDLKIRRLNVRVLAARPHDSHGELHGIYQPRHGVTAACITVWMRTARQKRVVAFRTFLRTFLHEFGHHLDYELFKLADSFHTEGFFKRESSLVRQLAPVKKREVTTRK